LLNSIFNKAVKYYLKYRYSRIKAMQTNAPTLQAVVLTKILRQAKKTKYGLLHKFSEIKSYADFKKLVPLNDYESLKPYINTMMAGGKGILHKGKVQYFAKSSGTTNDRSKYIPMPPSIHYKNHVAASWDTMSIVYHEDPKCEIFCKKSTIMGGSINKIDQALVGDVSAILLDKMHWAGRPFFTPDFETTILADWETKIERMAHICKEEPVVMIGGVPTWTLVLCKRILELTGKSHMHEVWPNLKYYMHGGVGFEPYKKQFAKLFPAKGFKYYEIYNASEGYFAVSDSYESDGMLLLVNNDIFYEFIPVAEIDEKEPNIIPLAEVELDKVYAIVISTSAGLWRYVVGDTITFSSLNPYRIKVAGRTKQCINVFGEEVMVANTDKAVSLTSEKHKAIIREYTVGPIYMQDGNSGGHKWLVEFEKEPLDLEEFAQNLDQNLRNINSDYDAKRSHDIALKQLEIKLIAKGTFHKWMRQKGKYGGQNKVPRLRNDLKYINEIMQVMKNGVD